MIHYFKSPVSHISLPKKFTYPFHYTPHPLCVMAAEEVKAYIATRKKWHKELNTGKMFGVLVVETETTSQSPHIGYLAAFSGNLDGKNLHSFFVPPIYDLLQPDGFFKREEEQISAINLRIKELESGESFKEAKQKWLAETEQAQKELTEAKAKLKEAKEKREKRRNALPSLSEEEQAALIRESQFQKAEYKRHEKMWKARTKQAETAFNHLKEEIETLKAERKMRSAQLQQQLFEQFHMLNAKGEIKDLCTIFNETVHKIPPAGTGECALPKLLQYAYLHHLKPLAMAEFWWGCSPKNEIRRHGYYYPSCKGKCEPILQHMLQGLAVDENPLLTNIHAHTELEIVYEDEWLVIVNKPAGMLSVPGKAEELDSVYQRMKEKYPLATGPLIVHRLDMATSGLLLIAKTKEVHQHLQAQFEDRSIRKRYIALLEGELDASHLSNHSIKMSDTILSTETDKSGVEPNAFASTVQPLGRISLPLCLDPLDRPRQMVSQEFGKEAITEYELLETSQGCTRIAFYPLTGRTHQLRVHAAHPLGLNCAIRGDELYGRPSDRLYLHAEYLAFRHPVHGEWICVQKEADF